jgi:hypothetical protein
MLKGAKRENKSVMDIAKFYTDAFFEDCRKLNIKRPDVVEPATNCIAEYIKIIERLLEKEYAYVAGGNVYFDSAKLEKYYIFNDHNEEDLAVGVREGVEEDTNKRNKNDFVLWFTKSKFEDQALKWDSPWGVGYPGWHIECSGISMKHLGEDLDIHCGGIDNAFPHHTNEIAQSEAYLGHKWCKYWMHVLHLNTTRVVKLNPTDPFDVTKAELIAREQVVEMVDFLKSLPGCGMENAYLLSTALEIGVRESRMVVCEHMLNEMELKECTIFDDAIATGNYDIDIHNPEGSGTSHYYFKPGEYYTIPYRSLIPKKTENLLVVGRCIGATHAAQASIRIMPITTTLGEAAGHALAQCHSRSLSNVRDVDIRALHEVFEKSNVSYR